MGGLHMKKIDYFNNIYSVNKTLRTALVPVGETEQNFIAARLLEDDQERAKQYKEAKKLADRYHRDFIEEKLQHVELKSLDEYASLYMKSNRSAEDNNALNKAEELLRKEISMVFTSDERYSQLFKVDMIKIILPEYLQDEDEIAIIKSFEKFFAYFDGYNKNRANMYVPEAKTTSIANRCINDNLPKYLDNIKSYQKICKKLSDKVLEVGQGLKDILDIKLDVLFTVRGFNFALSQSGIERYNKVIGGYTTKDGKKIQGINEYVNLYNQTVDKRDRLPLLKPLYKQILSLSDKISFVPEKFESDQAVLDAICDLWSNCENDLSLAMAIKESADVVSQFDEFDMSGIYVKSGANVTNLSKSVFGNWNVVAEGWNCIYGENVPQGRNIEKYIEKREKAYKAIASFSLAELQQCGEKIVSEQKIAEYIKAECIRLNNMIAEKYSDVKQLLTMPYDAQKKLYKNDVAIEKIKVFLDSIKSYEHFIKMFIGTGKEEHKDNIFYGKILPLYAKISEIDKLYDKVRNYMTQRPYSTDKIKLNFENPQFIKGWDKGKEYERSAQLLRKDGKYYLLIMAGKNKEKIKTVYKAVCTEENYYEKMCYKQMAEPAKDIPNLMVINGKTVRKTGRREVIIQNGASIVVNRKLEEAKKKYLPRNIYEIYKKQSYLRSNENFSIEDLRQYIDYYKQRVIEYHKDNYVFEFKNSNEYSSYKEFTDHVNSQAYQITFIRVGTNQINALIASGDIYLFQIYNKDFSEKSHGTPNLHTLYFRMLFDEKNLKNVVYQLNGSAEMFYREASISEGEMIKHKANMPIDNKNANNPKKTSVFKYDIIKDKRFTRRQFLLHMPITLNFKAEGLNVINHKVREAICECTNNHIIGIDRGERNLLYISVIDEQGKIVKQLSLNEIINSYNGVEYKTDYHQLLDRKENERLTSRQSWKTIENIRELKEGYLSQVVHKICELVVEYDAIIAMEDLNTGFKNSRTKVEKQVYQKFEKMLIDKLSYMVDKKLPAEENGGLLRAHQLVNKPDGKSKGKQNGFIFYIPAWLTSKIDPTTGFVSLIKPKYTSIEAAKEFIGKFKFIQYNSKDDLFEFGINYSDFDGGIIDYQREWTICSYGERIRSFRSAEKNNKYDYDVVYLTESFKSLLNEYSIMSYENLKRDILQISEKAFFERFLKLLSLTLQMRNSVSRERDIDYMISPVRNNAGEFYDSRKYKDNRNNDWPQDADANGAYNIARKALYAVKNIKEAPVDEIDKVSLAITNKQWLAFAQGENV